MGNDIYISAPEKPHWRISPKDFAARLDQRWHVERLAWIDDPEDPSALQFELKGLGGWVDGYFQKDEITLILEHYTDQAIGEIAVWYRSLVPPEQALLILSTSGIGYSELKPTDTAHEVSHRFDE